MIGSKQAPDGGNAPGTIITFYSYKGGTGRSMSLANVAWILASAGKRVLAIDWDLEAPGLHRYFAPFLRDKKLSATEGIINFADEYRQKAMTPPADRKQLPSDWYLEYADLTHYAVRLDWDFANGGYLDFVPAGQQDEEYSALVNSFNWKTFFVDLGGNRLLDATKKHLRKEYDYVLIDSRTGVSDTSGICTVKMPEILVVCFTLNNQSVEGAASVANGIYSRRGDEIRIFPVPMRLDNGELKKLEVRSEHARKQFFLFPNCNKTRDQYWKDIHVYYVTYYAYDEVLAPFGEKDSKIASMLASAERLTAWLTDGRVVKLNPPAEDLRLKKLAEYEGRELASTPPEKLSQEAQSNFRRLTSQDQEKARQVLLRLVRVPRPEEKAELSRQRVVVNDFGADGSKVLSKLRDAQLIQLAGSDEDGNSLVEITNDELLLGWPELRKWIDSDREFLLWRQQLHADVVDWKQNKRGEKWLSDRANNDARRWLKTRPDHLTADEAAFLRASISASNARKLKIAAAILLAVVGSVFLHRFLTEKLQSKLDRADAQRLATEAQPLVDAGFAEPSLKNDELQLGALLALESQSLAPSDPTKALVDRAVSRLIPARRVASVAVTNPLRVVWNSGGTAMTIVTGRTKDMDPSGASQTREDRAVELLDVTTGKRIAGPIPFRPGVQSFSLSSDGRYVAFSHVDVASSRVDVGSSRLDTLRSRMSLGPSSYQIELLDITTGEQTLIDTRQAQIYSIVFSPDSRWMITTGNENTAVLIDVRRRQVLRKIRHQGIVTAAAFSPDSQFVATAADDYYARVWRVSDPEGSRTAFPPIEIDGVASKVLFTPDQRRLITLLDLSGKNYAQMWEGQEEVRLQHSSIVVDVAVSSDGKYVATLAEKGEINIWDAAGPMAPGGEIKPLQSIQTPASINRIMFSSGSVNYLVATGDRAVANVWRLPDLGYAALVSNDGSLNDVAFDPTGRLAIVTERVHIWQFDTEVSWNPCVHLTRKLSAEEWQRYLPKRPYRQICAGANVTVIVEPR